MLYNVTEVKKLQKAEPGIHVHYLRMDTFKKTLVPIDNDQEANIAVVSYMDRNLVTINIEVEYIDEIQKWGSHSRRVGDWIHNLGDVAHWIDASYRSARIKEEGENPEWVVYTRIGKKSARLNSERGEEIERVRQFIASPFW